MIPVDRCPQARAPQIGVSDDPDIGKRQGEGLADQWNEQTKLKSRCRDGGRPGWVLVTMPLLLMHTLDHMMDHIWKAWSARWYYQTARVECRGPWQQSHGRLWIWPIFQEFLGIFDIEQRTFCSEHRASLSVAETWLCAGSRFGILSSQFSLQKDAFFQFAGARGKLGESMERRRIWLPDQMIYSRKETLVFDCLPFGTSSFWITEW